MDTLEIERKFLVHKEEEVYKKMAFEKHRITQAYILSSKQASIRVRISDEKAFLTIKGPSDSKGITRSEFEKQITLNEAHQLLKLCQPGFIEKTRYLVSFKDHIFEVDEFYGENEGLVMAEVELKSEEETFEKPDFIGDEVTGDRRFYNSSLLLNPFTTWRDTLKEEYR